MISDNTPLLVNRNEAGFWVFAEQIDLRKSTLNMSYAISGQGGPITFTGSTVDTAIVSVLVPGGLLGPNGSFRLSMLWTYTNNANVKNLKARFGNALILNQTLTTSSLARHIVDVFNCQSVSVQRFASPTSGQAIGPGASAISAISGAVNTDADAVLEIAVQLASAGDSVTLEGWRLEVFPAV